MNDSELAKKETEQPAPEQAVVEPISSEADAEKAVAGQEPEQASLPQPSARRAGLLVAVVALLLALGIGVATYLLWRELGTLRQAQQQEAAQLTARVDNLQSEVRQLSGALTGELTGVRREQEALQRALDEVRAMEHRGRGDWVVAEVEYLMRIANDRVQLQRDVDTAVAALRAADDRLRDLSDPAFHPVRAQLAREITALEAVREPDIPGLTLVLNSLAERAEQAPLSLQYHGDRGLTPVGADALQPAQGVEDWRGFLHAVWEDLKSLVVVRRNKAPVGAMLPPDQEFFLHQNLRLKLETAQLAALQRNEAAYRGSLQTAREWLTTYFDGSDGTVTAMLTEIDRLEQAQINPPLPDISGSLRMLRETTPAAPGTGDGRAQPGAGQP